MFDFWFGLIENKPLAEWKLNLGPKIQEKWGNIFLIATLCFFCISIFGWTICCVCPSTYESTIPLVQTKGCRPSSTGTTSEVVMDIPRCSPSFPRIFTCSHCFFQGFPYIFPRFSTGFPRENPPSSSHLEALAPLAGFAAALPQPSRAKCPGAGRAPDIDGNSCD